MKLSFTGIILDGEGELEGLHIKDKEDCVVQVLLRCDGRAAKEGKDELQDE